MATFPGRNGRITFMRDDPNGFAQVWVADSDLSHARQLTDYQATSGWSAWSPDGSRIVFDSDVTDPDHDNDPFIDDIFTMKPDGTDVVKLTNSIGYAGGAAAYSPDGRLIVFEADRGDYPAKAGIYVMNAKDGSHVRRITSLPEHVNWDGAPRFSPDGKRLVFTRFRDGYTKPNGQVVEPGSAVFTVKLDGSDLNRLSPWELSAGDADWSPDGSRLVFEAYPPEFPRGSAWVVGANGHGLKNLTPAADHHGRPGRVRRSCLLTGWNQDHAPARPLLRRRQLQCGPRDDAPGRHQPQVRHGRPGLRAPAGLGQGSAPLDRGSSSGTGRHRRPVPCAQGYGSARALPGVSV